MSLNNRNGSLLCKGSYTPIDSKIGFGCPGIPTFAFEEGRLYLSSNIGLPSSNTKSGRRVCQKTILESICVYLQ
jgi:hypothetical protein